MADRARIGRLIGDGVVLAGQRIEMRMRGERSFQRAVEGIVGLLFQRLVQFDRIAARFDQRPGTTGDVEDVGVHRVEIAVARSGSGRHAQRRAHRARADPAVAIPQRLPVLQRDAVDHAVADEPVIAGRIGRNRVRADPQVAPVQRRRDRAGDGQVDQRHLAAERLVDAGKEGMIGLRQMLAVEVRDDLDALGDDRADRGFDGSGHDDSPM